IASKSRRGATILAFKLYLEAVRWSTAIPRRWWSSLKIAVPQRLKPHSKQGGYRSGEPLRHPKSSATSTFSASCEAVPFQSRFKLHHYPPSASLTRSQQNRRPGRYHQSMLKMRRERVISRPHRPAILVGKHAPGATGNDRFDGYHQALVQDLAGLRVRLIRELPRSRTCAPRARQFFRFQTRGTRRAPPASPCERPAPRTPSIAQPVNSRGPLEP